MGDLIVEVISWLGPERCLIKLGAVPCEGCFPDHLRGPAFAQVGPSHSLCSSLGRLCDVARRCACRTRLVRIPILPKSAGSPRISRTAHLTSHLCSRPRPRGSCLFCSRWLWTDSPTWCPPQLAFHQCINPSLMHYQWNSGVELILEFF